MLKELYYILTSSRALHVAIQYADMEEQRMEGVGQVGTHARERGMSWGTEAGGKRATVAVLAGPAAESTIDRAAPLVLFFNLVCMVLVGR